MARRIKAMATSKRKSEIVQDFLRVLPRGTQITCVQTFINDSGTRAYLLLVSVLADNGQINTRNITQPVGELLEYTFTNHKDRLLSLYTTGYAQDIVGHLADILYNDPQALRCNYFTESFYSPHGNEA